MKIFLHIIRRIFTDSSAVLYESRVEEKLKFSQTKGKFFDEENSFRPNRSREKKVLCFSLLISLCYAHKSSPTADMYLLFPIF